MLRAFESTWTSLWPSWQAAGGEQTRTASSPPRTGQVAFPDVGKSQTKGPLIPPGTQEVDSHRKRPLCLPGGDPVSAGRCPGPCPPTAGRGPPTPIPPHPGQLSRIQDLVARKLEKTQELLAEVQGLGDGKRKAKDPLGLLLIRNQSSCCWRRSGCWERHHQIGARQRGCCRKSGS